MSGIVSRSQSHLLASELVSWLEEENKSKRDVAEKMGQKLKEASYLVRVKEKEKDADKPFADDATMWQFVVRLTRFPIPSP